VVGGRENQRFRENSFSQSKNDKALLNSFHFNQKFIFPIVLICIICKEFEFCHRFWVWKEWV